MKKLNLIPNVVLILVLVILYLFNPSNLNPMFAEGAFTWLFVISAFFVVNALYASGLNIKEKVKNISQGATQNQPVTADFTSAFKQKSVRPIFIIVIVGWFLYFAINFISSPIFNSNAYRDQLGEPEITEFSEDVQLLDLNQVPIVDKSLARTLADKKLGENPGMGSQVIVGEPVIQQVNGELVWVVPLEHSGFFKWFSNMDGSPGYITVSATNLQDIEFVEAPIKYQPDCYFFDDIERYIRVIKGCAFDAITDYSFEIDDNNQPYWIITTYSNNWLYSLPEATGVIVLNATNGELNKYAIDEVPDWIDRVQPENFIVNQIDNQGEYVHGIFNFSNKDKFMSSGETAIIYNEGNCYLFTGLTSVGADESAIGFLMVDMVTKETKKYQISGATEYAAMQSAKGSVQQYGYQPTSPIIINHKGVPTYFITLKDASGLIKQYSFVSVADINSVGVGETISDALRSYDKILSNSSSFEVEDGEIKETTGEIIRIASENTDSGLSYKIIISSLETKIFSIDSNLSPELAISMVGDKVSLEYVDTQSALVNVTEFDNLEFEQE